jgi:preprotein translocase subunit SecG
MLTFLLVVHAIITAILVGVILVQKSEGGGLGMGGSPTGLMSARGAADFLTRATTVLATLFISLSIASAVVASRSAAPAIDTSLKRASPPVPAATTAPSVPLDGNAAAVVPTSNASTPIVAAPANTAQAVTAPKPTPAPAMTPKPERPEASTRKPVVTTAPVAPRAVPQVAPPAVVPTTSAPATPSAGNAN